MHLNSHEAQSGIFQSVMSQIDLMDYCSIRSPEELVEVSVLHVLKDHDERVTVHADSVELHDVLVLEVGEQFSLSLEIFPG